jgi:hypothetical protein
MLLITTLAGMTPGPERQMRKRHISLSVETSAPPVIHVSAGVTTVLLFDSPVLPASLQVGTGRERFERLDLTEQALILLPRQDLPPHEHVPLTLRFADGHIPHRATFALVSEPPEQDHQVRVFRTALAPEPPGSPHREDPGRSAHFFSHPPGRGVVARTLQVCVEPEAQRRSPLSSVSARAFIAPASFTIELSLQLEAGQPAWRPGRVEARHHATRQPVPVRTRDPDRPALQPGTTGQLLLELPVDVLSRAWPLSLQLHELGGDRLAELACVSFEDAGGGGP